ncbi:MAG: MFS transporter [Proteobacteria bacterium]|nr:MFS transporter [Pseudomonadota bacterium]
MTSPTEEVTGRFPALRLSIYYGVFFSAIGIYVPFWPLWLASRGAIPDEIGILLAVPLWIKVISNPAIAALVDRRGDRKRPQIVLAFGAFLTFSLFVPLEGFWPLLVLSMINGVFLSALMPISENLTLLITYAHKLDYGRIRLWGSLTFMLGAIIGGELLTGGSEDVILWTILATLGLTVMSCFWLPDIAPVQRRTSSISAAPWVLLRQPTLIVFFVAAGFLQSAHAVYYGFSALAWRAAGIGEFEIGVLWAVGVLAEIALFSISNIVIARISPTGLMALAGAAGILRWILTSLTDDIALLVPIQMLHALTYGAAHIGAMHFIARAAPPSYSATAQSLYSAISLGVIFGTIMLLSGYLFRGLGTNAYLVMSGFSLAGLIAAVALGRLWSGTELKMERLG